MTAEPSARERPESGDGIEDAPRPTVVFRDALEYARGREYRGWDYCDGMSSRLRTMLPVETRATNLLVQETVKRAPINLRPYLLVERRRNFAGAGLFATANLTAHRLAGSRAGDLLGDVDYAGEATALLDWLVETRLEGYSGFCGAHQHEIQHLEYVSRPTDPSVVSTVFPAIALLRGAELGVGRADEYGRLARSAADFVVDDLEYRRVDGGARINYNTLTDGDHYTINGGALAARLFLELYAHTGEARHRERATALLDYIETLQTPRGGWPYRHPSDASHLSMDNFHNGFVIEAFLRYSALVDDRYAGTVEDALEFYRAVLFDPDGAPNHDESSAYPKDIHDVAEGVAVFSEAGRRSFAETVLSWGLDALYDEADGRFLYQRRRLYTKRFTLMRWCQAWMVHALARHLATRHLRAPWCESVDGE